MFKKYWDILSGLVAGITFAVLANFQLEKIQLCYSIIILILVSIGVFRFIKQSTDKNKKERKHTLIDDMVDNQPPVKSISLAQDPTKEGERVGELLLTTMVGGRKAMKKIKELWDKYKGYLLSIALGVLTLVEDYGSYINAVFDGKLVLWGYEVVPVLTLVAAVVVGIISNGYTKDDKVKIKALLAVASDEKLVHDEIKKTIKSDKEQLAEFKKTLANEEKELIELEKQKAAAISTHQAKQKMLGMTPQLATPADVAQAHDNVLDIVAKINTKTSEIVTTKQIISDLETTINALKTQLKSQPQE